MQSNTRVVIADDMEPILLYLEKVISEVPEFEVVAKAKDGKELIEHVLEHKPDLVITDVEMPELSGTQVVEELNKQKIKTRYIFITGNGNSLITTKAKEMGILKVIKKPILDDEKFISQIKEALQQNNLIEEKKLELQLSYEENKKENIIMKIIKKIFKSK